MWLSLKYRFQDPMLSTNGKRNNQVLYMNFILGEIEKRKREAAAKKRIKHVASMKRTLLLTTDGDTSFEFKDVDALVDSLVRDEESAGACGRIRPLGSGMMAWYQQFEYASGHWFQKTAEHVLGTVQCCPGCFSIWRMSRLNEILHTYSQPSKNGQEYLRKDQGEDRWMCTLLIEHGWRMTYCAAAVAYTFAPEDFSTFFDQRRRWLASTMANLYDLIRIGAKVAKKHGRSGLPLMYRIYIFVMFSLGLLTPATIILLVAGGIELAAPGGAGFGFLISVLLPLVFVLLILWQEYRRNHKSPFERCCRNLRSTDMSINSQPLLENSKSAEQLRKEMSQDFRKQQINLAYILSIGYAFLLILVLIGLLINAFNHFLEADNLFFLSLVALFISTMILHPRDLPGAHYGVVYFLFIPMAYLILYMYAFANMNVMSWGTRNEGAAPNEDSHYANLIAEDPIATDASLTQREASYKPTPEKRTLVLAKSLQLFFEVPVYLSGTKTLDEIHSHLKGLAERESVISHDPTISPGSSCMGVASNKDAYCAIILPEEIRLSTISLWLSRWKRLDGMQKVLLFCDTYHPLLANLASRRAETLNKLKKYGNNIRDYVVKKELDDVYRNAGRQGFSRSQEMKRNFQEAVARPSQTEEARELKLQQELDSLRSFICRIILLMNLFWPVFVVAMSLSPQLFVFHSNTAGLVFLGFCGIVLAVQFLCMLVHRWETFIILVSLPFDFERSIHLGIMKACRSVIGPSKHVPLGVPAKDLSHSADSGAI
eukprot:gb/GECG01005547.1/.p1 GENE.gb/GECG01005547.1/~~gb/GECG01005547.1/.p1  ORF type:complete len:770 (+),score=74.34 gb/GECG01005547.1/:1-2310(+)